MEDQFEQKIFHFVVALSDVYREEEEKESPALVPLELKEEELTEDFTAMVYAQCALYKRLTGDDIDILGFTHLMNRLVFQQAMKDKGIML